MPRPFMGQWRNELRDSDVPRTAKLVGHTLATYMDASGAAYPALLTLANGASLGRGCTAVKAGIEDLEDAGLLEVDRKRGRIGWTFQAVIPRAAVGLEAVEIPREPNRKSHGKRAKIPRLAVGECAESAECVTTPEQAHPSGARLSVVCECGTGEGNHASWCEAVAS